MFGEAQGGGCGLTGVASVRLLVGGIRPGPRAPSVGWPRGPRVSSRPRSEWCARRPHAGIGLTGSVKRSWAIIVLPRDRTKMRQKPHRSRTHIGLPNGQCSAWRAHKSATDHTGTRIGSATARTSRQIGEEET